MSSHDPRRSDGPPVQADAGPGRNAAAEPAPLTDAEFAAIFADAGLSHAHSPLLVAVSGGPDSTALMGALAAWAGPRSGPPLRVATVDHGLRPESRAEAEAVREAAAALGLPHAVLAWTDRPARVSQEAARRARYRLLSDHARAVGAGRIVTAHTADDQAETVLMRLAEGSGLTGLAGMAAGIARGDLRHIRPFLTVAKHRLVATCRARPWLFAEDPANADPRFARSRWRALMPALAAEGLAPGRLGRFAGRMRRAEEALRQAAEAAGRRHLRRDEAGHAAIDVAALAAEPEEIALRVLLRALGPADDGGPAAHLRLDRVETALAALLAARAAGAPLRRTLAGRLLVLDRDGTLEVRPEPARSRGRRHDPAPAASGAPQSSRNPSLGIG